MEGLNTINTTEDSRREHSISILAILLKVAISLLIILGNTLNLMVLPKLSDINEVSKIFHLALSLMDLVVGIVTLITVVFDVVDGTEFVRPLCITTGILNIVAPTSSVCILVLLHVDRFLSITKPLRYPGWITPRKAQAQILIACVSLTGIVVIGIGVSPSSWDIIYSPGTIAVCMADFSNTEFAPYIAAIMLLVVWLPADIIFVMYCRIICISLKASGQIRRAKVAPVAAAMATERQLRCAQHAHPGNYHVNNALEPGGLRIQIISSVLRSLKMPLIIYFVFFLSWGPFSISLGYVALTGIPYPPWVGFFVVSSWHL